jgi:hypothetical protein
MSKFSLYWCHVTKSKFESRNICLHMKFESFFNGAVSIISLSSVIWQKIFFYVYLSSRHAYTLWLTLICLNDKISPSTNQFNWPFFKIFVAEESSRWQQSETLKNVRTHPFLFFLSHSCEVFCYLFVAGFVYSLDEKHFYLSLSLSFSNRELLLSCTSAVHRWVSIPCTNFPRMKWEPVEMKSVSTHGILTHKNAPSRQPAYVIRVSVSCVNKRKKRHFKNIRHSKSKSKKRRRRKYSMLLDSWRTTTRWDGNRKVWVVSWGVNWGGGRVAVFVCVCVYSFVTSAAWIMMTEEWMTML